jgi:hypothetical protein
VVLLGAVGYLAGQRVVDRGSRKLAHPGDGTAPEDEVIEL